MLEAVNSVLQTSPYVRGNAEQTSSSDSFAANPDRVQKIAQAPYISPYYTINPVTNTVVMQIRNPATGQVLESYPSGTDNEDRSQDDVRRASPTVSKSAPSPAPSTGGNGGGATAKQVEAFAHASEAGSGGAQTGGNVTILA